MIASYYLLPTFRSMKSTSHRASGTVARFTLLGLAISGFLAGSIPALADEMGWSNDPWGDTTTTTPAASEAENSNEQGYIASPAVTAVTEGGPIFGCSVCSGQIGLTTSSPQCPNGGSCSVECCCADSTCSSANDWLVLNSCQQGYVQQGNTCVAVGCTSDNQCDDGSACDGIEKCVQGECQPGTPVVCGLPSHADAQCATPYCYEDSFSENGYSCSYDFAQVNTSCDDGDDDRCTFGNCNFVGQCETVHIPMCIPTRPTSSPRPSLPPTRCDTASGMHWCDPWGCVPWDVQCDPAAQCDTSSGMHYCSQWGCVPWDVQCG